MKFNVSCFVRVQDVEERNKLIRWCEDVIWRNGGFPVGSDWIVGEFVLCIRDITYCCRYEELFLLNNDAAIDCGENIELFKALAAMNDENDYMQWYVNEITDRWSLCIGMDHVEDDPTISKWEALERHKASVEEIIEHFKKHRYGRQIHD